MVTNVRPNLETKIDTGEQAIEKGLKKASEWSFFRLNFMWGCRKVSPGCDHCYIGRDFYVRNFSHMFKSPTRLDPFEGKAFYFNEQNQLSKLDKQPDNAVIFVNGLSDTFGEFVPVETVEHWHDIMEARPWYQFLLSTKRTGAMSVYYRTHKVPKNVWVGTTMEDRKTVELRLPLLKSIDAKIRWISFEPLLEDVGDVDLRGIQWIAVGGETGKGYRPFDPQWAKNLKAVAERDKVAFFYEGANGNSDNHRLGGNLLDGKVCQQYPSFEQYARNKS